MKYLSCLVCGAKTPGGFPRGVGTIEIFPLRIEESSSLVSDVQDDVYPPQVMAHYAVEIRKWPREIAAMETFLYCFIEAVGSQLVYAQPSASPQARHSAPTVPDVHAHTARY